MSSEKFRDKRKQKLFGIVRPMNEDLMLDVRRSTKIDLFSANDAIRSKVNGNETSKTKTVRNERKAMMISIQDDVDCHPKETRKHEREISTIDLAIWKLYLAKWNRNACVQMYFDVNFFRLVFAYSTNDRRRPKR